MNPDRVCSVTALEPTIIGFAGGQGRIYSTFKRLNLQFAVILETGEACKDRNITRGWLYSDGLGEEGGETGRLGMCNYKRRALHLT
jgi:hypothetical protein